MAMRCSAPYDSALSCLDGARPRPRGRAAGSHAAVADQDVDCGEVGVGGTKPYRCPSPERTELDLLKLWVGYLLQER